MVKHLNHVWRELWNKKSLRHLEVSFFQTHPVLTESIPLVVMKSFIFVDGASVFQARNLIASFLIVLEDFFFSDLL